MAGNMRAVVNALVRTMARGVAVLFAGWIVSGVCIGVGVWVVSLDSPAGYPGGGAGPAGVLASVMALFARCPWAMSSIAAGMVGVVAHVALAQKFLAQSAMAWAWEAGGSRFLEPVVERCLAAADAARPGWMTGIVKWGVLKANLLVAMRKDPEIGAFRKWLFGRVLVKLSIQGELPVGREALGRVVVERIRGYMSEIVEPSMALSGVAMFGQLMFALAAVLIEGR